MVVCSAPTEGELVCYYLYRRAVNLPLPCNCITDVTILRHNLWDIVPIERHGKYLFMQKEIKFHGSHRSNRVTGNRFWRSSSKEKPIYYTLGDVASNLLVGMKCTPTFYYGKGCTAERTKWGMKEFRLADAGVLPCPTMRRATGDGSKLPYSMHRVSLFLLPFEMQGEGQGQFIYFLRQPPQIDPSIVVSSWGPVWQREVMNLLPELPWTYARGLRPLGPTRRTPGGVGPGVRQGGHTPQKGFRPPEATRHAPEEGTPRGLRGGHIPQKGFGPPEATRHAPEEGTPGGLRGGHVYNHDTPPAANHRV
uniref:NAC domain-containing protein n=1 Tax=Leersia perrieri TaxID=77586 RepID=A0A0D9XSI2_9ORYZ